MYSRYLVIVFALLLAAPAKAQQYYAYVAAESEDTVDLIRFDGAKAEVVERIAVGQWPTEIEGPHGLTVSPDGKYWYLTLAHGQPFGLLYKYETESNTLVDKVELGLFPATMQISKATGLLYAVNFNLHGDHEPSTVSVVDPETMTEITRIETGVMPHGSRLSPDGLFHYSLAMMSDELYEIDAQTLEITRTLNLAEQSGGHEGHHGMPGGDMKHPVAKPTWVIPHPDGQHAYVAYNGANVVAEVDLKAWMVTRKFKTGKGPYNVEVTPDGEHLVVTYKSDAAVGIWHLKSGTEVARIPTTRKVPHGITITPDSRYAMVTVEGIGGEPGTVDLIDLSTTQKVTSVDVGKQAGGIAFWKKEE